MKVLLILQQQHCVISVIIAIVAIFLSQATFLSPSHLLKSSKWPHSAKICSFRAAFASRLFVYSVIFLKFFFSCPSTSELEPSIHPRETERYRVLSLHALGSTFHQHSLCSSCLCSPLAPLTRREMRLVQKCTLFIVFFFSCNLFYHEKSFAVRRCRSETRLGVRERPFLNKPCWSGINCNSASSINELAFMWAHYLNHCQTEFK